MKSLHLCFRSVGSVSTVYMRKSVAALIISGALVAALLTPPQAKAQTYSSLYSFAGPAAYDGENPFAGLVADKYGNLYGTTVAGGLYGFGTVFELVYSGGTYSEVILHSFNNTGGDGVHPEASLLMDASGNLYGTTQAGGGNNNGTVFELAGPLSANMSATILHSFSSSNGDGYEPIAGLIMDGSGNLYGTTEYGGGNSYGTVFELAAPLSAGMNDIVLHGFGAGGDGSLPGAGVIMDSSGNLYGTTGSGGGYNDGIVFELAAPLSANMNDTLLHSFKGGINDGSNPVANLLMDSSGNLYGTTREGGAANVDGTVFELAAPLSANMSDTILHSFTDTSGDGAVPVAGLIMDSLGNLYGTTQSGGAGLYGIAFELTAPLSTGMADTVLHSFSGSGDGAAPDGGLVINSSGNFFGTTQAGGTYTFGTVFEVTPVLPPPPPSANFSSANVCPSGQSTPAPCHQAQTLTYPVTASTTFGSVNVLTLGAPKLDFTLTSTTCTGTIAAGNSCTVTVQFAPLAPGLRMGAVQILNSSGNLVFNTFLQGTGLGSAVAFGPGTQITLNNTEAGIPPASADGVAVDGLGDVFMTDANNNRVVEAPAGGLPTTTVGTGLSSPNNVAVDGAGDVLVADTGNNRVVEVTPGGIQTVLNITVGGMGLSSPFGVAVDGAGDIFIADSGNNRIVEVTSGGTQSVLNITVGGAGLSFPFGVALDGTGDLFVADSGNNRVLEAASGGAQTVLLNTAEGVGLSFPLGIGVDPIGDVYIGDTNNNRVVEVTVSGAVTTVGSGLNGPVGVALDATGDVYVAQANVSQVVEIQQSQPPAFNFPPTAEDVASAISSFTFLNIGNQPLTAVAPGFAISSNSFQQTEGTGTPPDCYLSSTTYPAMALAPGAGCNVSIEFIPQTLSPTISGMLTFTDNALNASTAPGDTQLVNLSGTVQMNTPTGTVTVTPVDTTTGTTPATLTFANVTTAGNTTLTTSSTGPTPPAGYATGSPAVYYNLSTTATYSGSITVCVNYSGTSFSNGAPSLWHYGGSSWTNITTSVNAATTTACGATTSLSPFALFQAAQVAPTVTFTGAPATAAYNSSFSVSATTNAGVLPMISGTAGVCSVGSVTGAPTSARATVKITSGTGTCKLTATWSASSGYLAASATQTTTAEKASSSITVNGSPNPSAQGVSVTVSFSVTGAGTPGPTGTVNVSPAPTGETCGPITLTSSGTGYCSLTFLSTGGQKLTATYSGDTNFAGSSSSYTQTVTAGPVASVSPSTVAFGNVYLGTIGVQDVTLTNNGAASMTFSGISISPTPSFEGAAVTLTNPASISAPSSLISNGFFAIPLCVSPIAPGKSCAIIVVFIPTPKDTGVETATLTIKDNAPGNPQSVPLSATMINPQATLSSYLLAFGTQKAGTSSAAKSVILTNTGSTPLSLNSVAVSGAGFALTSATTCVAGETIAAGKTCAIDVSFAPAAKEAVLGAVTIKDNALLSPQVVVLTGTGD